MNTHRKELYICIVWEQATPLKDEIITTLKAGFRINRIFRFHWDKDKFLTNLIGFYAHSQKQLDFKQYTRLLHGKMAHCGVGSFYVIVFEDLAPKFEMRMTSSGKRLVNVNVFDKKSLFREKAGGGHKIHSSDNAFETNKDLTLLFGMNTPDFLKHYPGYDDTQIIDYTGNCLGVDGFRSIEAFFYLLNNTIEYVILRNYECLPDQYTIEGHGDIDLLVENLNYIVYLTHAEAVFPKQANRVHYTVGINGQRVPFDFRYKGDNYLDLSWQLNILKNRQLKDNIFYVPDAENYYYSLMYHACVQKPHIKPDYVTRLQQIAVQANIPAIDMSNKNVLLNSLSEYMAAHKYDYVVPIDKTVCFNRTFLKDKAASRYGKKIHESICKTEEEYFFSKVYETENSIVKVASITAIENENDYLTQLKQAPFVPKVIRCEQNSDPGLIEISKISGKNFRQYFEHGKNYSIRAIRSVIEQGLNINKVLIENDILHRDMADTNFIICDKGKETIDLVLIDFGWSSSISGRETALTPCLLGWIYAYRDGEYSDLYSFGLLLKQYFGHLPLVKTVSAELLKITPSDYADKTQLLDKLQHIADLHRATMPSVKDRLMLLWYREPVIRRITRRVRRLL
ncbi:MAG: hypothetical protein LBR66_09775 [Candidatus Symbiothrix sp.]|jgi:hypothetical protein|nr:hypothetical protein [Candidatus Symbiothrix sp.]